MNCPFLTDRGSCIHVDAGVGVNELIIITPDACEYCAANYQVSERKEKSVVVESWIRKERNARQLTIQKAKNVMPGTQESEWRKRMQVKAEHIEQQARKAKLAAPIMTIEQSLTICNNCPYYRGTRLDPMLKCRKWCDCTEAERADPTKADSEPCPKGWWRR